MTRIYGRDRSKNYVRFFVRWACYLSVAFMLGGCFGFSNVSRKNSVIMYSNLSVVQDVKPLSEKKITVRIDDVNIPMFLDRKEVVVEDNFGQGQRMKILEEHNWIEALGTVFARVLRGDLSAYLPNALVVSADMFVDNADLRVSVFVDRFVGSIGGQTSIDAKVVVRDRDGKIVAQDNFQYSVGSGEDFDGYIMALNECVSKLAEKVAKIIYPLHK